MNIVDSSGWLEYFADLIRWFESLKESLDDNILPVDRKVALKWGEITARCKSKGITNHVIDTLIGATAIVHNAVLITRSVSDFEGLDVELINPWK